MRKLQAEECAPAVARYHEAFLRHRLQLNHAAGKSACLVAPPWRARERKDQTFILVEKRASLDIATASASLSLRAWNKNLFDLQ